MTYRALLKVTGYVEVIIDADDEEDARDAALSMSCDEFMDDVTDIELDVAHLEEETEEE